jgi:hypothetical protein
LLGVEDTSGTSEGRLRPHDAAVQEPCLTKPPDGSNTRRVDGTAAPYTCGKFWHATRHDHRLAVPQVTAMDDQFGTHRSCSNSITVWERLPSAACCGGADTSGTGARHRHDLAAVPARAGVDDVGL